MQVSPLINLWVNILQTPRRQAFGLSKTNLLKTLIAMTSAELFAFLKKKKIENNQFSIKRGCVGIFLFVQGHRLLNWIE